MTCEGCANAVRGSLNKLPGLKLFLFTLIGIEKIEIDLPKKIVVVEGSATKEEILQAIKKTG